VARSNVEQDHHHANKKLVGVDRIQNLRYLHYTDLRF
jgi:hypothetical protein